MGGGWQVTVPQLEAWTFSRRARGRGKVGGDWMQMGQQAVSLKWKPGQDMKRTGPGRGMYGETRSYSSGKGAGKEGWMLICVFVCGRV